jgi:hypothetical protein
MRRSCLLRVQTPESSIFIGNFSCFAFWGCNQKSPEKYSTVVVSSPCSSPFLDCNFHFSPRLVKTTRSLSTLQSFLKDFKFFALYHWLLLFIFLKNSRNPKVFTKSPQKYQKTIKYDKTWYSLIQAHVSFF